MRGNSWGKCGHTFSYLALRFTEIIWNNPIISGINWTHLKTSEFIWIYLKLSGINWTHLKTSEIIWIHLNLSEYIWNYFDDFLKLSETIWNYLKLSEKIRHCVKLGNSALHKIRQLHIKIPQPKLHTVQITPACLLVLVADPAVKIWWFTPFWNITQTLCYLRGVFSFRLSL